MSVTAQNGYRWYREPWPWLLLAGPFLVILAGAVTSYLAVVTNDGLVADDYYKRGLAINQTLARDDKATQLGYRAKIAWAPDFSHIEVTLTGGEPLTPTGPLLLRLAHGGRTSLDRVLPLTQTEPRTYVATFPPLVQGRWRITLEDGAGSWRLVSDMTLPGRGVLTMAPR